MRPVGAFHLPEQGEQHDGELGHRIGRVAGVDPDRVSQVADPDAALGKLVDQVQRVPHGAAQAVQGVHHDHVTGAGVVKQGREPGPVGGGAGLLVQIDPLCRDPGAGQCVDLPVEVLLGGRNPRGAQLHAEHRTASPARTRIPAPGCGTNLWDATRRYPAVRSGPAAGCFTS